MSYHDVIIECETVEHWSVEDRHHVVMPFIGSLMWLSPAIQSRLKIMRIPLGPAPLIECSPDHVQGNNIRFLRALFDADIRDLPYVAVQTFPTSQSWGQNRRYKRTVVFEIIFDPGINHDAILKELRATFSKMVPSGHILEAVPFILNATNALRWSRRVFAWADPLDWMNEVSAPSSATRRMRRAFGRTDPSRFIISAGLPYAAGLPRYRDLPYP